MSESLRLVFFGTPRFAIPSLETLLASPHEVVCVVTQPDRPSGRGRQLVQSPVKILATSSNIPVWQPTRLKDAALIEALRELDAHLGIVAAYGRILPEILLEAVPHGLINVHASVLPRYRGAAPVQRAVMAGETETGVSIMQIVAALDAGPLHAVRTRSIGGDETSEDVERDLARLGADLLPEVIAAIAAGRARPVPQDDRLATYAPRLTKTDGVIAWEATASTIHNQVRGLHPWPLASTHLGRLRCTIRRTSLADVPDTTHSDPGAVIEAQGDRLVVAAGRSTAIRILEIQPDARRAMTAREFLAGHRLGPDDRFGDRAV